VELAEKGALDYLVFECLGERTIALANQAMMGDATKGYDPLLEERMNAVLPLCKSKGFKVVTNMGAANPTAAGAKVCEIARQLKLPRVKVAVVTGDDVLEQVKAGDYKAMENGQSIRAIDNKLVSANAYLGVQPIVDALAAGADVVITGRTADPALFLAPLIHEFGWAMDDWQKLGQGTLVGHLLECGSQVSGGYFCDPGFKDVPNLARIGFPLAEVSADGTAVITKVDGSGGLINSATCKEQLLYEVHDPTAYFQPDVVADFSNVKVQELGSNRVRVSGASGKKRPDTLKVTLGHMDGYIGEGEITYAGPGAVARATLAGEIVAERLKITGVPVEELRCDLIGINSLHQEKLSRTGQEPYEVRLRVAARTKTKEDAAKVAWEVETLWVNGPAAGGGARRFVKEVLAVLSVLVPREQIRPAVHYLES
jgi:hypothetical protein